MFIYGRIFRAPFSRSLGAVDSNPGLSMIFKSHWAVRTNEIGYTNKHKEIIERQKEHIQPSMILRFLFLHTQIIPKLFPDFQTLESSFITGASTHFSPTHPVWEKAASCSIELKNTFPVSSWWYYEVSLFTFEEEHPE